MLGAISDTKIEHCPLELETEAETLGMIGTGIAIEAMVVPWAACVLPTRNGSWFIAKLA
jgi:hypothetical protein